MDGSLGIVVPAYDPDLDRLTAYLRALGELDPAAVRVELDDPDGTVRDRLGEVPASVHVADRRRGKGAAITAGFEALSTDTYGFVDADGSTPVGALRDVVEPVRTGTADVAVGSRRHPEAVVTDSTSPTRETLGDGFAWLGRRTLPVSLYDYQCGAKAVDAEAWARLRGDLYEAGFGWDVDLLAAAGRRGLTVTEVPIEWTDRPGSTVAPLGTAVTLAGALLRAQRRRLPGSPGSRPLLERLADGE